MEGAMVPLPFAMHRPSRIRPLFFWTFRKVREYPSPKACSICSFTVLRNVSYTKRYTS